MLNISSDGNKLNDYESNTPKGLTDSPAGGKLSGTENNTDAELVAKSQDTLLCGKKRNHTREGVLDLAEGKKTSRKEFSAKYPDQPNKGLDDQIEPSVKHDSAHLSQVSLIFYNSANGKESSDNL